MQRCTYSMHTLSEYTPPNKRYRHTDAHDLLTKATVPAASTHDKKNKVIACWQRGSKDADGQTGLEQNKHSIPR